MHRNTYENQTQVTPMHALRQSPECVIPSCASACGRGECTLAIIADGLGGVHEASHIPVYGAATRTKSGIL